MKLNRLIVATDASEARTMPGRAMNRAPAASAPLPPSSVCASAGRMRARKKAEPRNDSASAATANGADSAWTSSPPRLGPATNDTARLPCTSELPWT